MGMKEYLEFLWKSEQSEALNRKFSKMFNCSEEEARDLVMHNCPSAISSKWDCGGIKCPKTWKFDKTTNTDSQACCWCWGNYVHKRIDGEKIVRSK